MPPETPVAFSMSSSSTESPPRDVAALFADAVSPDVVLSDAAVIERRYLRNVTALSRAVPVVLVPRTEDEVRRIVAVANEHRVALYPFSTGRNWGLGSKLPVTDGCAVVDLSRLTRIVEVNEEFGYAVIEPGVTQGQLAAHLREHHPSLTMNFTGSFAFTSVSGNTLERGDGMRARVHDLLGVRGVLGSGAPFEAGGVWANVGTGEPSHHARHTAGPDLAALFTQSNFGVVTQLAFKLLRKPQRTYLVWGIVRDERLEDAVTALRSLGQQGVFPLDAVQLGYSNRFVHARDSHDGAAATEESAGWLFYAFIGGTGRTADAIAQEIVEAMAPLCTTSGAYDHQSGRDAERDLPPALLPLLKLVRGTPDAETIKTIYQMTGTPVPEDPRALDADAPPFGMKSLVSVIPFSPRHVRAFERVIEAARSHGVAVKPSIYGDGRALITIPFRRDDPADVDRAERAEAALWEGMDRAGFAPYRVAVDRMASLVAREPERFDVVARIKSALDPNGVVSPGRYARV